MKRKEKLAAGHAVVTLDEALELADIPLTSLYSRTKERSFLAGFEAALKAVEADNQSRIESGNHPLIHLDYIGEEEV